LLDTNSASDRVAMQQKNTNPIVEMMRQSNLKIEYPKKTLRVLRA